MNEYLELQKEVVDQLRKLGVHFQYTDRLALFFLRNNIPRLYAESDHTRLVSAIDRMVALRTQGLEPKHHSGTYLK